MDNDNQAHETPDDALEDNRYDATFHPGQDQQQLPEDGDTPASSAHDVPMQASIDEPAGDTDVDADELYQEGRGQAIDENDREVNPDERPKPLEPRDEQ